MVCVLLTLAAGARATGGEDAPRLDSRLGRDFSAWLELLNEADTEAVRAYVADRFSPDFLAQFPVDTLVAFHLQVREQAGRLSVWPPAREARNGLETLARGSRGGWFRIRFVQEPEPPHRIVGLQILPAEAPAEAAASEPEDVRLPATPAGEVLAAWVEAFNARRPGAIADFERRYRNAAGLGAEPAEARERRVEGIRDQVGRLTIHRILEERDGGLSALAFTEQGGDWLRLDLRMDGREEGKLASLRVSSAEPPELAAQAPDRFEDLADLLRQLRGDRAIPALAAAWVVGDRIVDAAAVGTRRAGGPDDVTTEDLFHIGSVTKSLTATAIARRIAAGDLDWRTSVGDVLPAPADPDSPAWNEHRKTTVEQLLGHLGRIPPYTQIEADRMAELHALEGSPRQRRAAFARQVLDEEALPPGHRYSNAGYTLAAVIAEARAETSWEELLRREVFVPLGLASAGFGWPAWSDGPAAEGGADGPKQPVGHFGDGVSLRPQQTGEYSLPVALAPAGDVHLSVLDLARYARAHLGGLAGREGPLAPALVRRLHTPAEGFPEGPTPYAGGWLLDEAPGGGPMHWHNGSAGTYYAFVGLLPADDAAFVLVANVGPKDAEPVALTALRSLLRRHREAASAPPTDAPPTPQDP